MSDNFYNSTQRLFRETSIVFQIDCLSEVSIREFVDLEKENFLSEG